MRLLIFVVLMITNDQFFSQTNQGGTFISSRTFGSLMPRNRGQKAHQHYVITAWSTMYRQSKPIYLCSYPQLDALHPFPSNFNKRVVGTFQISRTLEVAQHERRRRSWVALPVVTFNREGPRKSSFINMLYNLYSLPHLTVATWLPVPSTMYSHLGLLCDFMVHGRLFLCDYHLLLFYSTRYSKIIPLYCPTSDEQNNTRI